MKALAKNFLSAVIFAVSVVTAANATEFGIQLHGLSHHFSSRRTVAGVPWNEVNYGFAITARQEDLTYAIGVYKNSLSTKDLAFYSPYAIVDYQAIPLYDGSVHLSLGGFVGVVSGYPTIEWNKDGSVGQVFKHGPRPALGLSARAEYQNFDVTFRLTPPRHNNVSQGTAVMSVETGYKF